MRAATLAAVLCLSGCSFMMVRSTPTKERECRRRVAVFDTVVVGATGLWIAVDHDRSSGRDGWNFPATSLILGLPILAVMIPSAIYGHIQASRCADNL
jgi:uncharacterized protein YceK